MELEPPKSEWKHLLPEKTSVAKKRPPSALPRIRSLDLNPCQKPSLKKVQTRRPPRDYLKINLMISPNAKSIRFSPYPGKSPTDESPTLPFSELIKSAKK